jgi:hypothetical protein
MLPEDVLIRSVRVGGMMKYKVFLLSFGTQLYTKTSWVFSAIAQA